MKEEILDNKEKLEELDASLRPKRFADFIGQEVVKNNLEITVKAALQRQESSDHILLYGPPGLGKTTLAHIVAYQMQSNIRVTSGPAIERAGDLASILTNLAENDILFIDEIHRLNRNIEEVLYPAMEDHAIDLVVGKGPSAQTIRLDLPKFTLVGATTRIGSISSPLRDRFGIVHRLEFYTSKEIEHILKRSAKILKVVIEKDALSEIARRARFTPRIANKILKRVRDFAQVKGSGIIDIKIAKDALKLLEIDEDGLDPTDRKLLTIIIEKFNGGPVGLNTLAASMAEETSTLEEVNEPYLLRCGFITRTPKGRMATSLAFEKLGLPKNKLI